ncbi:Cation_efflux-domain-containing protein, partial [Fragilariopsis cylindrus CCMP1102]
HMGHSHSHHDHGRSSSSSTNNNNKSKTYNKQERMVRRLAIVLVCWIATCGTKLFQAAKLTQNDWISFVVTSVALTSADNIKKAFERSVDNFHNNQLQQQQQQQQQYHDNVFNGDTSEADRVTWIGVWVNLFLSVGKLAIGITSHSSVLVADAGHSLSDLFSDFITLWSVNVARIPPDDDHPYGHYKFEAIGSLFLSLTLLATGASVVSSTTTTAAAAAAAVQLPGPLALAMAGISIASKEWLFRITKQVGDRLRSPVVIANAWHHRSDAYSSILALLSIAWAMTGFAAADAAAGILVAGMICMTGSEILIESVKQLSDGADSDLQTEVFEILNELDDDDVIATTSVRARQMGSAASVDVTVEIPSVLSTTATRAVENRVKQRLLVELARRRGESFSKEEKELAIRQELQQQQQTLLDDMPSTTYIEQQVRNEAKLMYPKIRSVEGVTVHFTSQHSVTVDVNVRITEDDEDSTENNALRKVREYARELKGNLETKLHEIESAQIYLDLNTDNDDGKYLTLNNSTSVSSSSSLAP